MSDSSNDVPSTGQQTGPSEEENELASNLAQVELEDNEVPEPPQERYVLEDFTRFCY